MIMNKKLLETSLLLLNLILLSEWRVSSSLEEFTKAVVFVEAHMSSFPHLYTVWPSQLDEDRKKRNIFYQFNVCA